LLIVNVLVMTEPLISGVGSVAGEKNHGTIVATTSTNCGGFDAGRRFVVAGFFLRARRVWAARSHPNLIAH
jgi:hypothetical protein